MPRYSSLVPSSWKIEVYHQPCVVLAASRLGYKFLRVLAPVALHALIEEVLLEGLRAVARHHVDGLAAPWSRKASSIRFSASSAVGAR